MKCLIFTGGNNVTYDPITRSGRLCKITGSHIGHVWCQRKRKDFGHLCGTCEPITAPSISGLKERSVTCVDVQDLTCPKCGGRKTPAARQCIACFVVTAKANACPTCPTCGGPKSCRSAQCMACARPEEVSSTTCPTCGGPKSKVSAQCCKCSHIAFKAAPKVYLCPCGMARQSTNVYCADCLAARVKCPSCGGKKAYQSLKCKACKAREIMSRKT